HHESRRIRRRQEDRRHRLLLHRHGSRQLPRKPETPRQHHWHGKRAPRERYGSQSRQNLPRTARKERREILPLGLCLPRLTLSSGQEQNRQSGAERRHRARSGRGDRGHGSQTRDAVPAVQRQDPAPRERQEHHRRRLVRREGSAGRLRHRGYRHVPLPR
ncbi:hypothetical protein LTR91_027083, partial [Friedmanniomyces endolithicus]